MLHGGTINITDKKDKNNIIEVFTNVMNIIGYQNMDD